MDNWETQPMLHDALFIAPQPAAKVWVEHTATSTGFGSEGLVSDKEVKASMEASAAAQGFEQEAEKNKVLTAASSPSKLLAIKDIAHEEQGPPEPLTTLKANAYELRSPTPEEENHSKPQPPEEPQHQPPAPTQPGSKQQNNAEDIKWVSPKAQVELARETRKKLKEEKENISKAQKKKASTCKKPDNESNGDDEEDEAEGPNDEGEEEESSVPESEDEPKTKRRPRAKAKAKAKAKAAKAKAKAGRSKAKAKASPAKAKGKSKAGPKSKADDSKLEPSPKKRRSKAAGSADPAPASLRKEALKRKGEDATPKNGKRSKLTRELEGASKLSEEEQKQLAKRALASRKSSAYHVARQKAKREGLSEEQQLALAKEVSNLHLA